jgi:hypothetical protein
MRLRHKVAVALIAAGSLLTMTAAASSATAVAAQHAPHGLHLRAMPGLARLDLRAIPIRGTDDPDSTVYYELQANVSGSYCLNANNAGSTAGKDGDKVQLWDCSLADNEQWYETTGSSDSDCDPVNDYACQWRSREYTSMCLNANDSPSYPELEDADDVQLYSCNADKPYNGLWEWLDDSTYGGPIFVNGDGPASAPYIMTVDLGNGTPGNGTQVWVWQLAQEPENGAAAGINWTSCGC